MVNQVLSKITKEQIKEIQDIDKSILPNSLISSIKEIQDGFDLIKQLRAAPNPQIDRLNKMWISLFGILEHKINLTKEVLGSEKIILVSSEEANELQQKIVFPENGKVIQHPASNNYFQGYTRIVVLGSPTEFSEKVSKLIQNDPKTEAKIDEISKILVEEGKESIALNLSIDLFEKHNLKKREEVEKRFIFELLPLWKGIKVDQPSDKEFQKLTLLNWVEFLNDSKELMKNKANIIKMAVKDIKDTTTKEVSGHISLKTQIELEKFNRISTKIEDEILDMIAKELKIKKEDLVFDVVNSTDAKMFQESGKKVFVTNQIEDAVIVFDKFDDLKKKCIEMLNDKSLGDKKISNTYKYFTEGLKSVLDFPDKLVKEKVSLAWSKITQEYKDGLETSKDTTIPVEDKEKIVTEAENKAFEIQNNEKSMSELEIKIRKECKELIDKKLPNPVNQIEKILKNYKREIKKENLSFKANVLFKELSDNNDNKSVPENNYIGELSINVAIEYPEIWKTTTDCKTLEEVKKVIEDILSNKETTLKSSSNKSHTTGMIAAALCAQYIPTIPEYTDWDVVKTAKWWKEVKDNYKKKIESPNVEESSSGILKKEDSIKNNDGKTIDKTVVTGFTQGEDKSSANVSNVATQQDATGQSAGQTNVNQQKQDGGLKEAIIHASDIADIKKDSLSTNLGKSQKATSVEKTGQSIVVTKENNLAENQKDVEPVVEGEELKSETAGKNNVSETSGTMDTNVPKTANTDISQIKKEGELGESAPTISTTDKKDVKNVSTDSVAPVKTEFQIKYEQIFKEKDTKQVRVLAEEFLLETKYKTFTERVNELIKDYLYKHRNWSKQPPMHEMLNFISSIITKSDKLNVIDDAKAFLAYIESKKKAKIEAEKNNKKKK